jgi:hypothetical protein
MSGTRSGTRSGNAKGTAKKTVKASAKATVEETAAPTTNATAVTREDRERLLARMWVATANSIVASLEDPEGSQHRAACIQVARQFLQDQHVTHDTLDRITGTTGASMQRMLDDLPEADMGPQAQRASSRAPSGEPYEEPSGEPVGATMRISPEMQKQLDALPEPD